MKNLEEIFNDAYNFFVQKRFSDAIISLRSTEYYADASNPEFQIVSENLKGFCFLGLNELESARQCFEKALNLDPSSSQACAGLGEILFLNHQDTPAKTMFEYAIQNDPENKFAREGLAKVNSILNLPENHNSLLDGEELRTPDIKNVVIECSELFSKGQFEQTVDGINSIEGKIESELTDLRELLTELLNMKATALININELDEARISFEKALNLSPDSSTACWGLAEIFFKNNMLNEAKTMYEWALRNDENNLAAKEGISKVNRALGPEENEKISNKPTLRFASSRKNELD